MTEKLGVLLRVPKLEPLVDNEKDFLKMTITDILAMLKEEGSDSMEAKLTNNDGLGVLVKISYEPVEVE